MMNSDDKFFNFPTTAPSTPPRQFDGVDFSVGFDSWRKGNSSKRARFDSKLSDEELAETLIMLSSSGEDSKPSAVFSSCPGNIPSITGAIPVTGPSTENENKLTVTTTTLITGTAAPSDVNKPIQMSFPQPVKNGRSYKCSICGKAFSSHQALGGHKTSHRVKFPRSPSQKTTPPPRRHLVGGISSEPWEKASQVFNLPEDFHEWSSIGRHERLNYDGAASAKSVVTSSNNGSAATNSQADGVGDSQTTPVLRDIDLNLSPPPSYPELDLKNNFF